METIKQLYRLPAGSTLIVLVSNGVASIQAVDTSIKTILSGENTFGPYSIDMQFYVFDENNTTVSIGDNPVDGTLVSMPPGHHSLEIVVAGYTLDSNLIKDVVLETSFINMVVELTTDGSGGPQILNIPNFELDENGANNAKIGYRISIVLVAKKAEGDIAAITINGGEDIYILDQFGEQLAFLTNNEGGPTASIPLLYNSSNVSFIWMCEQWYYEDRIFGHGATINKQVFASGSFETSDGKNVTVQNGIITLIEDIIP